MVFFTHQMVFLELNSVKALTVQRILMKNSSNTELMPVSSKRRQHAEFHPKHYIGPVGRVHVGHFSKKCLPRGSVRVRTPPHGRRSIYPRTPKTPDS